MLDNVQTLRADPGSLNKEGKFFPKTLEINCDVDFMINIANDVLRVLDCLSVGIMIVDAGCEPAVVNRYAEKVLRENDGLFLKHNCLKAASAEQTRELKSSIEMASNGAEGSRFALSISRPSCLQPLLVLVAPAGTGSVVVYITDPERKTSINPSLISDLFDLTPAESAVAALVVQGKRISQIAETLNISIHTVRCHLKHVFSKTGTERQAELANYVGSLLGKLSAGEKNYADDGSLLDRSGNYTASRRAN